VWRRWGDVRRRAALSEGLRLAAKVVQKTGVSSVATGVTPDALFVFSALGRFFAM